MNGHDELHMKMLIGGEWVDAVGGDRMESIDPATERPIGTFPAGDERDAAEAVSAALDAAPGWRDTAPTVRGRLLREFASRLKDHEDELAELDARESGNPRSAMLDDVRGAVTEVMMFAGLVTELKGTTAGNGAAQFAYSLREPYGVVGRIIPYNHAVKFAATKIAAPLAAGNTVVLKPAEVTSLSGLKVAELLADLLPPGVINVLTGVGATAGAALAADPRVPRVAFTGSVAAGRAVLRAGADSFKRVTCELGGKNPMIVLPDVDVDAAAGAAVKGMNFARSQGQSCQSNSRVFVHADIAEEFVAALVARVQKLVVGDPLEAGTDLGPLAFKEHFERVMGYIAQGREEGATLLAGGDRPISPGYFVSPTVFTDVTNDMTIAQEEIFGPVVSVLRWTELDEVIAAANDVDYGLTANIWTNELRTAHRIAHALDAGYVWINGVGKRVPGTAFGGFKASGIGKESSIEELLDYTREKVVAVSL